MKIKSVVAAAIILALSISNTHAQVSPSTPTSNQRIKQGIKRGELTKAEAATLHNDQKDLKQDVKEARKEARKGGDVARDERRKIRHDKKHLNRKFFNKKHNNRQRH